MHEGVSSVLRRPELKSYFRKRLQSIYMESAEYSRWNRSLWVAGLSLISQPPEPAAVRAGLCACLKRDGDSERGGGPLCDMGGCG